jgi:hypothetical protein
MLNRPTPTHDAAECNALARWESEGGRVLTPDETDHNMKTADRDVEVPPHAG